MFSKDESKELRQDFWIAFGKSYPRKWILYHTKINGLALKFHFDTKNATVSLDIETKDQERRITLWEKLLALKSVLQSEEHLPETVFEDAHILENGKEISRIYIQISGVSIHNKNTWRETMVFFNLYMKKLEDFFETYKDILSA